MFGLKSRRIPVLRTARPFPTPSLRRGSLVALLMLLNAAPAHAVPFTVDSTGDGGDSNTADGACDDGAGNCTLRAAIEQANALVGDDDVAFDIGGGGAQTIAPGAALPTVTDTLTIDGTTQPGFAGTPLITLMGTGTAAVSDGLVISASNSTVKGLTVTAFWLHGIRITGGSDSRIGGTGAGEGNVVSGNVHGAGVYIEAGSDHKVQGNFIGTDATGTAVLANGLDGVLVSQADDVEIGGTTAGAGNLISGNGRDGVRIGASDDATVQGNLIGTDVTGTVALGNRRSGVSAGMIAAGPSSRALIGGTSAAARNVISGNESGVVVDGTGHEIQGNYIGTDITGTAPLGNLGPGVEVFSGSNNEIGGTAAGAGNIIANNGSIGVEIFLGTGNPIRSNSIFGNGNLGIDLFLFLVNPNDPGDADVGPNNLQNFPELTSAVATPTNLTVSGSLDSAPSTTFALEFFVNPSCHFRGHGEGKTLLGSANVSTDPGGDVSFVAVFPLMPGQVVTATATDPAGNTSEFSACRSVTGNADLAISKTDSPEPVGAGADLSYVVTATNNGPSGAQNLAVSDPVPAGTTFVSADTSAGGTCTTPLVGGTGTVECTWAGMTPVGTSRTLDLVVKVGLGVPDGTTITNSATVASDTMDPGPSPNDASAMTLVVNQADLSVDKDDGMTAAVPGGNTTYLITVTNTGPADVVGATVSDAFPPELSCTWTCAAGGGAACTAGPVAGDIADSVDLPAGDSAVYTAVCAIDPAATSNLTNTATVTTPAGVTDPEAMNNSNSDVDTLTPTADLSITKTDGSDPVAWGSALTYTVTVSNAGPSDASMVVATDTLPGGVTPVSTTGCLNDPGGVPACSLGTITAGASKQYTIEVTVNAGASGSTTFTNQVSVTSDAADPSPANNAASEVTTAVPRSPNLSLAEKAGYALLEQGLSILAAVIDHTSCALTAGTYPFSVSVGASGAGTATVDDLDLAASEATTAGQSFRGTLVMTTGGPGEVDDTVVDAVVGAFGFSRLGDVMYGNADFTLDGPANRFDEHIVKDFFRGPVFGATGANGIRDDGIEVITKVDFPRGKWRQLSQHLPPNGGVGRLSIVKELIAPEGFAVCGISIIDAVTDNAGDGYQVQGSISVQPAAPPALP